MGETCLTKYARDILVHWLVHEILSDIRAGSFTAVVLGTRPFL